MVLPGHRRQLPPFTEVKKEGPSSIRVQLKRRRRPCSMKLLNMTLYRNTYLTKVSSINRAFPSSEASPRLKSV